MVLSVGCASVLGTEWLERLASFSESMRDGARSMGHGARSMHEVGKEEKDPADVGFSLVVSWKSSQDFVSMEMGKIVGLRGIKKAGKRLLDCS